MKKATDRQWLKKVIIGEDWSKRVIIGAIIGAIGMTVAQVFLLIINRAIIYPGIVVISLLISVPGGAIIGALIGLFRSVSV